ncbi:MAG: leucine-rich repeat domain-containing protein, partial [Clostridia bacterium]|nr:leucine-rich repeat domain-containing protein [Clostridia bacterium]
MKRTNKLWLALLLTVLVAALLAAGLTAAAEEPTVLKSGSCGDNVTWVLTDDGVLTVSGTGDMADWANSDNVPWYSHRSDI